MAGEPSQLPAVKAVLTSFKNRPFIILMIAFILSSFSFTVLTALVPYFIQYQLDMGDQVSFVLLAMLLTIGIFLIPTKLISDKINKGPAYALGLFIASLAVMTSFFLPRGATPLIYVIAAVAGMGFSAQWVLPWSMLPDVIEYDEKMTGERREGIYYGLWAFLTKFTGALGVAVSGWALGLFGYVPNVEQTTRALFGIRLFFAIVPAAVILVSLPFLIWYPITRRKHAELVKELVKKACCSQCGVDMKVVIIGSGMSGLTAGAYLAKGGYDVSIFEQFPTAGGVTATVTQDGYGWDIGPLLLEGLSPGDKGRIILEELGVSDEVPSVHEDRGLSMPEFTLWRPKAYEGPYWRRERLKKLFPKESENLDRYYRFYEWMIDLMSLARRAETARGLAALVAQAAHVSRLSRRQGQGELERESD